MKKYIISALFGLTAIIFLKSCELPIDPADELILIAEAGNNRTVGVFELVELDGSQSSTTQGSLNYSWTFVSRPNGSNSALTNATQGLAAFTPDTEGDYIIELTVSTGGVEEKDQVSIKAEKRALRVGGFINQNTTWRKINDAGETDYILNEDLILQASLTIEPGVIIQAEPNIGLYVSGANASLRALGSAEQVIVLTGREESKGFWSGIVFQNANSTNNELRHVQVRYGGGNSFDTQAGRANVSLVGNSRIKIIHTTLSHSAQAGLACGLQSAARISELNNLVLENNDGAPLIISLEQLPNLNASLQIQNNATNVVEVRSVNEIETNTIWPALTNNIPYSIINDLFIGQGTLTISEGVKMEFASNKGIWVYGNGALKAVGTANNRIEFTGAVKQAGYWRGVFFDSNNVENTLQFTTVEYGGGEAFSGSARANVRISDYSRASFQNLTLTHSDLDGLYLNYYANLSAAANITINQNARYPISTPPSLVKSIGASSLVVNNNGQSLIEIREGELDGVNTWVAAPVPYFSSGNISCGFFGEATITFEAGVEIIFAADRYLDINSGSSLAINGTAASPVNLRGLQAVRGAWRGIGIYSNNPLNVWNYANISGGGSAAVSYEKANIAVGAIGTCCETARLTLNNCQVNDSDGYGIWVYTATNTLNLNNVNFTNNNLANVFQGD